MPTKKGALKVGTSLRRQLRMMKYAGGVRYIMWAAEDRSLACQGRRFGDAGRHVICAERRALRQWRCRPRQVGGGMLSKMEYSHDAGYYEKCKSMRIEFGCL